MTEFGPALKAWRQARRQSQMDLAHAAGVSPRHLAFLETGRARPSRGMVLRLAQTLTLPHPGLNALLSSAGFAPHFPALPLTDQAMTQARVALDWMITRHAPYPALILDRVWTITALNAPAQALFGPAGFAAGSSLLDAAHPDRLQALVENWVEVGHHALLRLRAESAAAGGIPELDRAAAQLAQVSEIARFLPPAPVTVLIPTIYRTPSGPLALFSTFASFGSPAEVGLEGLRVELMFPADKAAEDFLGRLAEDGQIAHSQP
ncbi:helix-turn-helix domain-containing protein [Neogemmobacter tilapiae]|uniref:Transcriptional regulator n=1 Tax=Neogemmobacter tilapiae TaxID=875041 RepID=A0A918TGU8_9RHOB|nr:helix-turn-helix transcriptional regulator [Gemmobacter tilapiae]GHC45493.1 transcriptional regulator [Gemmobacter tilapiae]